MPQKGQLKHPERERRPGHVRLNAERALRVGVLQAGVVQAAVDAAQPDVNIGRKIAVIVTNEPQK